MKIAAIIQARMGSTRLPNKVMLEVEGKPVLWHVVNRLCFSKLINQIIIATTDNSSDDAIAKFASDNGTGFFRGSENDVLDRYYQTTKAYGADVIVRITSDCPLIDPDVVDRVINFYLEHQEEYDYAANVIPPTFPDGLDTEVFPFKTLERAWQEAKYTSEREHVTAYIYKNPDKFRLYNVKNDVDYSYFRWTVDTSNDLALVREIYKRLHKEKGIFLMQDIIDLLNNNPELMDINSDSKRNEGYDKSVKEDKLVD